MDAIGTIPGAPGPKLAIVESCGECVAFHVLESPRCLWIDHLQIEIPAHRCSVEARLDPLWLECLDETGGIEILSLHIEGDGESVRAFLHSDRITLQSQIASKQPRTARITVAGIARGHSGKRFPEFSRAQFERNQAFWASAIDTAPHFDRPDGR